MKRRDFIKTSGLGLLAVASNNANAIENSTSLLPTPKEVEGPFYPLTAQKDKDFDLTLIEGHTQSALGKAIFIQGEVVDIHGSPIEDATVDLWQANAVGKYAHPRDPNPALVDENFQGWAIVQSCQQGLFRFKTILPGAYPVSNNWTRPPHIHFKVSKNGYKELTTQMYFPDQPLNKIDRLLLSKSQAEQQAMIAKRVSAAEETYHYTIVLA